MLYEVCVWGNSLHGKLWDHLGKREKLELGLTKLLLFCPTIGKCKNYINELIQWNLNVLSRRSFWRMHYKYCSHRSLCLCTAPYSITHNCACYYMDPQINTITYKSVQHFLVKIHNIHRQFLICSRIIYSWL